MVDPAPATALKGPALPFLVKANNLNHDFIDEVRYDDASYLLYMISWRTPRQKKASMFSRFSFFL